MYATGDRARFGFDKWFDYFQRINPARFANLPSKAEALPAFLVNGASAAAAALG